MVALLMSINDEQERLLFLEMYEATVRQFVGAANRILRNLDEAEDIAYETYRVFAEDYSKYKDKSIDQMKRIGLTIVRNKSINFAKHRNSFDIPTDFEKIPGKMLVDEEDILEKILEFEEIGELKNAIKKLNDEEKLILELRYDAKLKYSDIGKAIGINEKSVENKLYYIKSKLKRFLEN